MNAILKKLTLICVMLSLALMPLLSEAVTKKNRKSTVSTSHAKSKHQSIKHRTVTKSKSKTIRSKSSKLSKAKLSNTKLSNTKLSRVSTGKSKYAYSKVKYRAGKYQPSHVKVSARKSYQVFQPLPMPSVDNYDGSSSLVLASSKALVINQNTNEVIFAKNTDSPTPIASVTKLMTAMVILDAKLNMDEEITISDEDIDYLKGTSSRLSLGTQLSRSDLLHLALIASENRAASALATSYPGGRGKFIRDMNQKALSLGMSNTRFSDSTGLDSSNVSTAEDLARMVDAAYRYQDIREISTSPSYSVYLSNRGQVNFNNTNSLVRNGDWDIGLSKTGFISEAGRCLVMQAKLAGEPVIIVLLDSYGKYSRIGDANRVRKWMEYHVQTKSLDVDNYKNAANTVSQIEQPL